MKGKLLLLLPSFLLASPWAMAQQRSFDDALAIAKRQAEKLGVTMDSQAASRAKTMAARAKAAKPTKDVGYYVFDNGGNQGFTIVSGDERMPEIVGYADNGSFSNENLPENLADFLKLYDETVDAVKSGDRMALQSIAEAKNLRQTRRANSTAVAPLLGNIEWNQSAPYNNLCPKYDGTNRAAAGCVATAMAQVMAYYQYPKQLQADIPAYTTKDNVSVSGIAKGETYDWSNMLPQYSTGNYTQAQADAVAKLTFHCGAAVQMNYRASSGANLTPYPLYTYFGYDRDMMDLSRCSFTLDEWTSLIDTELSNKRPVLYGGSSSSVGHQFVCDGSDGNGLYHINWGWGGYQNGYFDITVLNPAKGGIGSGNGTDGYNRGCSMIIGMQPDNGVTDAPLATFSPLNVAYWGTTYNVVNITKASRDKASQNFTLTMKDRVFNISSNSFTGCISIGVKNNDGTFKPVTTPAYGTIKGVTSNGSTYVADNEYTINYAFPVGKTTLYYIYSTDNQKTWKKCSYSGMQPYTFEATATSLKVAKVNLSASIKTDANAIYKGNDNTFNLTVRNDYDYEYQGLINIYAGNTTTRPDKTSDAVFMVIPPKSSVTRPVTINPSFDGDMYVWVSDNWSNDNLVEAQHFTSTSISEPDYNKLSIVSVTNNATQGKYETEKAIYSKTYKVKGPVVEADEAKFTYSIRNDGADAIMRYMIVGINGETMSYMYNWKKVVLPGGGKVTELTEQFSPEIVGSRSICSKIWVYSDANKKYIDLPTSLPKWPLYVVGSTYFEMDATRSFVYVAGYPTAIDGITADEANGYVHGGKGEITVNSDRTTTVSVYSISGSKIADVKVEAGIVEHVSVEAGIYVVNGKKIVVR